MNSTIKILTIIIAITVSSLLFSKKASAQESNVSFQVFYDQLSPYGQWINYPNYGYVWIPDAGSDFAPYSTRGHWIMTDYGWTWVSDYDWGWAPFHYGRWDYDNYYGWLWIPDNEWGPSWVTWRRADGYYGWEPMGPGISISASFGRGYNNHNDHWMFVRDRDIERSDINRYYVNRTDHDRIIRNSTVINKTFVDNRRHTTYVYGPPREDVQRVTGRKVNTVTIQENNKPGQNLSNGQLRIYRPQVIKNNGNGQKPAPTRITNMKDVKRTSERNASNQPKNVTQQDNKRIQQQNGSTPANTNNKAQPMQPQKVNPANNSRERQPNAVTPKNNNNQVQPTRPQNTKPAENNRREQQPGNVRPQETNKAQPVQPQRVNPPDNRAREQQQNSVKPQNNTNSTQPAQPQNTKPADNSRREQQQQNTVKPPENHNAQPAQPQRANPSNNHGRERQSEAAKPQNNTRNEQPKESKSEPEKRKQRD